MEKAVSKKHMRSACGNRQALKKSMLKYKYFYFMIFPTIIFYIIFSYIPMYGVVLAFKDFNFSKGILLSPWAGTKYFQQIFNDREFWKVFANTCIISFGRILFEFPVPVVLALLINEITKAKMRKFFQIVLVFPHFISWVVVSGIIINLLSDAGVINQIIRALGLESINFLTSPSGFRPILFISNNWKEMGWGTIIYLAALAGINTEQYEAAKVDGANRLHRIVYITWPGIRSVIGIMLILAIGNTMSAGFDQIFNLYNPGVYDVSDIIDTYVYRRTFQVGLSYSSSTAIGLFKSVINLVLLYSANFIVKRLNDEALF